MIRVTLEQSEVKHERVKFKSYSETTRHRIRNWGFRNIPIDEFECKRCNSIEFIYTKELITFCSLDGSLICAKCGLAYDLYRRPYSRGGTEESVYGVEILIKGIHDPKLFSQKEKAEE